MSLPLRTAPRTSAHLLTAGLLAALALSACGTSDPAPSTPSGGSAAADNALAAQLPDSIKKSKTIVFAAEWTTPPIIGVDSADTTKPKGVAVDLAAALGRTLGVTAKWENIPFPGQIPAAQGGKVDALFGQVSITATREKSELDLVPFYRTTASILVPAGNPKKLTKLADACGLNMGSSPGSTLGKVVREVSKRDCEANGKPAIKLTDFAVATGAISAVKAGSIDGWLDSTANLDAAAKAQPNSYTTVRVPIDEQQLGTSGLLGIAVSKSNPQLANALSAALVKIMDSGEYKTILEKHGLPSEDLVSKDVMVNPLTKTPAGQKS